MDKLKTPVLDSNGNADILGGLWDILPCTRHEEDFNDLASD